MWCGKCQADVAAEVSPDNQRVFCAACGTLLSTIDVPPTRPVTDKVNDRTKDARELLRRWSSGKVIDPFGPAIRTPDLVSQPAPKIEPIPTFIAESAGLSTCANLNVPTIPTSSATEPSPTPPPLPLASVFSLSDSLPPPSTSPESVVGHSDAISLPAEQPTAAMPNPLAAATESVRPVTVPSASPFVGSNEPSKSVAPSPTNPLASAAANTSFYRVDAAHPTDHFATGAKAPRTSLADSAGPFASKAIPAEVKRSRLLWLPTWDPAVWRSEPSVSGGWSSLAGQFLAYAGVLGMTAGACMVVWSYFGGTVNYAPTGWLLATAGQMLLFFGVVTLVSGGLEQTTEQVNKRIEQLGDHIIRIEQAAREMSLRGNSVPPAHFGHDPDAVVPQRSATSGYERSVVEE